jgi:lipopolysaccharide export system protein LptA
MVWRRHPGSRAVGAAIGLSLLLAGIPGHRTAAQLLNPSGDNLPLEVQADSGIEWQQNEKLYIARGNAVATRGPAAVHADTLIAHYRDVKGGGSTANVAANVAASAGGNTGGNTEIYRVEAEGNVTMTREGQTVVGDRAVYDLDQALMVVTGKALKLTTATDVVTARDSLEWYEQKQVAVGRGNAVAVRNGKTIKADILTAYMVKTKPADSKTPARPAKAPPAQSGKPSPTPAAASAGSAAAPAATESKISRVDAQGHVVVTNATDTGRGDYGVYNADTGICTLVDNVVIARGKDVIKGQYGVMDLNKNVSRMLPPAGAPAGPPQRVQGLFIRDDQAHGTAKDGGAPGGKASSVTDKKPDKKP